LSQVEFLQNVKIREGGFATRRTLFDPVTVKDDNLDGSQQYQMQPSRQVPIKNSDDTLAHIMLKNTTDGDSSSPDQLKHRRLLQCSAGYELVFNGVSFCGDEDVVHETVAQADSAPADDPTNYMINNREPLDLDTLTDSFGVVGYLCNDELEAIEVSETDEAAQVGPTVKICVERDAKAAQAGVYIRQIDAFSFYREGGIQQVAISLGGEVAANGLTELQCTRGSHKCWFETYLTADFFSSEGYVQGSGAASLQLGSAASRRRLGQEWRELQDEDVSQARRIRLEFLATTKYALAEYTMERIRRSQNDSNWLRYGLAAIVFLLGCVIIKERKSIRARCKWCSGLALPTSEEIHKGVDETTIDGSDRTTAVSYIDGSGRHVIIHPLECANTSSGTVALEEITGSPHYSQPGSSCPPPPT
jgi:hypothetical protein